ncbi:dTDP-glucose 4,6-dehydratase [Rubripirellula lacrimiformis]|uniref:dTDP-glucose 4,6-dehydratase n=1 Tax=Rubripirellula lacrimiformis TaxID=1930273 RepID=A0A517NGD4_9BACT|nr:NAD-dependent epimerase/dehydratase family protein [Rubripirellula lacrimiformis]QDT06189.1 dTDP-glucose 4,6-dehydratase [Rubripirellula lacrimiformis]
MQILVTGGTGLLGNTILRTLAEQRSGDLLTALVRRQPRQPIFDGVDVKLVEADLADPSTYQALDETIAAADVVIHSAAMIHIGWRLLEESMAVNRDGTAAIVESCLHHGKPLVHIGTVDTLALGTRRAPANETTPVAANGNKTPCSYVVSKRAGLEVVRRAVVRGLRCVVAHPGFMLGPWDWKPSSGRMIAEVARQWTPVAPSGGCSVCDSRDVAQGTIAAMDGLIDGRIESGREFILAGENWTYFELWREIAERTGTGKPIMPAGPGQLWLAEVVSGLIANFREKEGDFNTAALELASLWHWYDSSRARSELGYRWRDPHRTLDDAVQWVQTRLPELTQPTNSATF